MKNSTNNNLTIVLTLKDRPKFTKRWMSYMNDQQCPYKVLIADGGKNRGIEKHLNNLSNYKNLNYEYIRYPFDKTIKDFYLKQIDVIEKVKTKYLINADNDDFYLLEKIPQLLDFLDKNLDYSGCRGSIAYFNLFYANKSIRAFDVGENYKIIKGPGKSIENNLFIERAENFFNNVNQEDLWQNYYCILRTSDFLECIRTTYKYNLQSLLLYEILFSLFLLNKGKVKVTDEIFYLRQIDVNGVSKKIFSSKNLLELHIIEYIPYYLNIFLKKKNLLPKQSERIRIMKAYSNFIGIWCVLNFGEFNKKISAKLTIFFFLKQIFNGRIYFLVKKLREFLLISKRLRVPSIEKYIIEK